MDDSEERTPVDEAFCLHCGSSWFELAGEDADLAGLGGIRLNGMGAVVAYDGTWVCYDCGEVATFPQLGVVPEQLGPSQLADLRLDLPPLVTSEREQSDSRSLGTQKSNHQQTFRLIDPSRAAPD